tara:strand:+ start:504 stop:1262 length:759 start_codon:yes stop_codon:yes gene_type:complete
MRFKFGKNWKIYSRFIDSEKIYFGAESLKEYFKVENLNNKSFLDAGCGSGLFSICAATLGAKVRSFDYDLDAVECTREAVKTHIKKRILVENGDILDSSYIKKLGKFDYVYSWGVLHHTGNLDKAMQNIDELVKKKGKLFISIYNDQGFKSEAWEKIKFIYNKFFFFRPLLFVIFFVFMKLPEISYKILSKKKELRGMNSVIDLIDWLGGYPFETAKPEEVIDFFTKLGYTLEKLKTVNGKSGCNEFVFMKN